MAVLVSQKFSANQKLELNKQHIKSMQNAIYYFEVERRNRFDRLVNDLMSDICIYFSAYLLSVNLSVLLSVFHLFICCSAQCLSIFRLSTCHLICKLICLSIVLPNCLSMIVCVSVYVEICLLALYVC